MRIVCSWAIAALALASWTGSAQSQATLTGTNVTGQLVLVRTVDVRQLAGQAVQPFAESDALAITDGLSLFRAAAAPIFGNPSGNPGAGGAGPSGSGDLNERLADEKLPKIAARRLRPPVLSIGFSARTASSIAFAANLGVNPVFTGLGFNGLTHRDQRLANNGNQFSVEPPSPSIATGNGYVLQGVNNAIQIYNTSGTPLLIKVLSTNELFGLPAAIDRQNDLFGAFPTDMRVFFDHDINRWFVLQRVHDNDMFGNPINRSHLYIAVSQTSDPLGRYNIYEMDTTDAQVPGCPCVADYPQIGADRYGFYIATNGFDTFAERFVIASILAISKQSLGADAATPTSYRFFLPFVTGYEFSIQPATTPPGASYFLANGGLEYFVSSKGSSATGNALAVWAMYNTASLGSPSPNLLLTRQIFPTLAHSFPDVATQRPGPLPYGSTLLPQGVLAFLDGGDTRVLSVTYAGGRLWATLSTHSVDDNGRGVVGGVYVIFSPSFRAGVLAAPVLRQGYLVVNNNHILRPAVAVTPQGRGAIAFTLVGPDYFPSAAFVPINTSSTGSTIQVTALGVLPQDGFTGYPGGFGAGVARWGDYSAAVAGPDGIWMSVQYIPNAPRTEFANWGTFISRYIP